APRRGRLPRLAGRRRAVGRRGGGSGYGARSAVTRPSRSGRSWNDNGDDLRFHAHETAWGPRNAPGAGPARCAIQQGIRALWIEARSAVTIQAAAAITIVVAGVTPLLTADPPIAPVVVT